jgi:hypothetical protein
MNQCLLKNKILSTFYVMNMKVSAMVNEFAKKKSSSISKKENMNKNTKKQSRSVPRDPGSEFASLSWNGSCSEIMAFKSASGHAAHAARVQRKSDADRLDSYSPLSFALRQYEGSANEDDIMQDYRISASKSRGISQPLDLCHHVENRFGVHFKNEQLNLDGPGRIKSFNSYQPDLRKMFSNPESMNDSIYTDRRLHISSCNARTLQRKGPAMGPLEWATLINLNIRIPQGSNARKYYDSLRSNLNLYTFIPQGDQDFLGQYHSLSIVRRNYIKMRRKYNAANPGNMIAPNNALSIWIDNEYAIVSNQLIASVNFAPQAIQALYDESFQDFVPEDGSHAGQLH